MTVPPRIAGAIQLQKAAKSVRRAIVWVDKNAARIIETIRVGLAIIGLVLASVASNLLKDYLLEEDEEPG